MRKIYKYPLSGSEGFLRLPGGGGEAHKPLLLHTSFQRGVLCVWVSVDPQAPCKHEYRYKVVGTGEPMVGDDTPPNYAGTVMTADASFVFHVFTDVPCVKGRF